MFITRFERGQAYGNHRVPFRFSGPGPFVGPPKVSAALEAEELAQLFHAQKPAPEAILSYPFSRGGKSGGINRRGFQRSLYSKLAEHDLHAGTSSHS